MVEEDKNVRARGKDAAAAESGTANEDVQEKDKPVSFDREVLNKVNELYLRFQTNPAFKQQVINGAMIAGSLLVLFLYFMQGTSAGGLSPAVGGRRGAQIAPPKVALTKRQREDMEGIDHIKRAKDLYNVKRRFGSRKDIEEAQERERSKSKAKGCFRFPVQISRDTSEFTYFAPRKVFDVAVLQRSLKRMGWEASTDLKKSSLVLKGIPHVQFKQLRQGKMYYDMVSNLGRIGSKKKTQLATLRNYVRKFGCSFESLHLQPRSFDMTRPNDCKRFFQYSDTGRMWVMKSCKSGEGSKGAGITVHDDISSIRQEWSECEAGAYNYVAQAYIEHPLLVKGSKFDMRAYLFVASTKPYIVFFNPGYIRRSLAKYNPKSTQKDDVLTNYHVQMNRQDFTPDDAMWKFSRFIEYLQDEDLCRACGDIEIKLAKIARMVFDSGRTYYKRYPGSFQIVGLDFMMDEALNPMFIEGNVSPGLGAHNLKWKKDMMDDLVTLMYKQVTLIAERPDEFETRIGERVYGPNDNYWELVVHEQHENCDKQYKFDPCKDLLPEAGSIAENEVSEAQSDASLGGGGDGDAGGEED